MRLLLDTHTFLWFVWNDPRLSKTARQLLEESEPVLYLSAASAWEIAIKVGIGKLELGQDVETFLDSQMAMNGIELLPITVRHVAAVSTLAPHHKDPFDRLLVAQSMVEGLPIVSIEGPFDAYGVDRRW